MTLDMACEGCGQKYRLPAALAGKKAKCKTCHQMMTIPNASAPTPPPPPARSVAKPAKPPLQSFGSAPAPQRAKPALQSFGAAPTSAPARKPAPPASRPAEEPLLDFEEVDDADDPYGFDDGQLPPAKSRPLDDEEDLDLPPATKRPGRPGKTKKSRANYAGVPRRFAAVFIDGILVTFVNFAAGFAFSMAIGIYYAFVVGHAPQREDLLVPISLFYIASVIFCFAYYAGMVASSSQATVGKKAMGIKVCDTDGRPIGFGRAVFRELAKILSSIFLIGFIMALFTERKQALHDLLAGTVVVEN